ncbi:MFS transporter [Paraburkholderia sp. BCC1884]|uniref:MFS transporter n=1 Tax=Paraburkholderia sp. BCC1884 TaxID=2562668 RepID=UPI001183B4C7|nr:MFS transporter [Paraburkholderia sp. BCC1884]
MTDSAGTVDIEALYRRIAFRILPLLLVAYIVAVIDRVNVGFAQLYMRTDLGLSDAVYGLGAGIFFIGYVLFGVPSNLIMTRVGARKTFSSIMLGWGLVSMAMAMVRTPGMLYFLRFLLGMFEAGFFPGVVLYLTFWFPAAKRARVTSLIFAGAALSGVLGSLTSGLIMRFTGGILGLTGWQWLFLIEGLPSVLLAGIAWLTVADKPADASWLSDSEKVALEDDLKQQREVAGGKERAWKLILNVKVLFLVVIYFSLSCAAMAMNFWLPIMISSAGVKNVLENGVLNAIPYLAAMFATVAIARSSDRLNERRFHYAVCVFGAALAMSLFPTFIGNLPIVIVLLTIGEIGIVSAFPIFWSVPHRYLADEAIAGGLAVISCLGQLGGFVAPAFIGWIKATTGSLDLGLYALTGLMALGATLWFCIVRNSPAPSEQRDHGMLTNQPR